MRGQTSPYRRTFCMGTCEEEKDCRKNYSCIDMSRENDWGARVIQKDVEGTSVCIQVMSFAEQDEDQADEVCTGVRGDTPSGGGAGGDTN